MKAGNFFTGKGTINFSSR